jgi:hypothetical protein
MAEVHRLGERLHALDRHELCGRADMSATLNFRHTKTFAVKGISIWV